MVVEVAAAATEAVAEPVARAAAEAVAVVAVVRKVKTRKVAVVAMVVMADMVARPAKYKAVSKAAVMVVTVASWATVVREVVSAA